MEQNINKPHILVVDDEENICEILQYNLHRAGYLVKTASCAEEAISHLKGEKFDLILLDIMLGGMSGLEFAQVLREDYNNNVPIIFISALDTEPDILKGFKIGADDYISKPFSMNQVIARVGAVIKRYSGSYHSSKENNWQHSSVSYSDNEKDDSKERESRSDEYSVGKIKINAPLHKVYIEGEEISLTKTEFNILYTLIVNMGEFVSREKILKEVWKGDTLVTERTVDVHIARLRKKLKQEGDRLTNKSGIGYMITKDI